MDTCLGVEALAASPQFSVEEFERLTGFGDGGAVVAGNEGEEMVTVSRRELESLILASRGEKAPVTVKPTKRRSLEDEKLEEGSGGGGVEMQKKRKVSKKHVCEVDGCGREFTRFFNLKTHLLTHLGDARERPFQCLECGARFLRVHDLERHQATHGIKKGYICNGCGKGYSRIDALNRHIRGSAGCQSKEV